MKRTIPATMATQHPDNINKTFWNNKAYINTIDEVEEAYICWSQLGIQEYMWDWEGKFVDEAVVDKLFRNYQDYFSKTKLGQDVFLTYRIPNIWKESGYRVMRAFMNIMSIAEFAHDFGYKHAPVFEIILPMTESSKQMVFLKQKFHELAKIMPSIMEHSHNGSEVHLDIIPLFESVNDMVESASVLREYVAEIKSLFGAAPEYMRAFIARSDPAMNAGLIPAVLSAKAALSEYNRFENEHGVAIYPWLGGGSLPFRGNVSPERIDESIHEYRGLTSVTIQSSFRYDHDIATVKKAVRKLNTELPKNRGACVTFSKNDIEKVKQTNAICIDLYTSTIEAIADTINAVAQHIPQRRERMLHIGLFGYSRGLGKVRLPRAIVFTGSLYSLGIPPELIGTGRALRILRKKGLLEFVEDRYKNFKKDLQFAYSYLNKENLEDLARQNNAWSAVVEDVSATEEYLSGNAGAYETHHKLHRNETSSVYLLLKDGKNMTRPLLQAARLRKSIG